jgi:hypothetical protein
MFRGIDPIHLALIQTPHKSLVDAISVKSGHQIKAGVDAAQEFTKSILPEIRKKVQSSVDFTFDKLIKSLDHQERKAGPERKRYRFLRLETTHPTKSLAQVCDGDDRFDHLRFIFSGADNKGTCSDPLFESAAISPTVVF